MRFGASTQEKSDDDGECRFCVSNSKDKQKERKGPNKKREKKKTDILKP